jgi:hypothetical protein
MSDNRYAFISGDGVVAQVIVGALNAQQQQQFLRDYSVLFGATQIVTVDDETTVWIGGSYDPDSGVFSPPPTPEPEAVIEEIIPE